MNTEIRRKDRAVTDKEDIAAIIKSAGILHLGLIDGEFPYVIPLHYGYEYDEGRDAYVFYLHGAKEGHKLDVIRNNSNACIELETDVEPVSGGDIPCKYGSVYSSVTGRGKVFLVSDMEEKKHGLELLMLNQTGKIFEFTEQMISDVAVIKVEINCYTAKARKGSKYYENKN